MEQSYYLFFLNLRKNVPEWFADFSAKFSGLNVKLIPVGIDELKEFIKGKNKIFAIVFTPSIYTKEKFLNYWKETLMNSLLSSKLCLFHISSFDKEHFGTNNMRNDSYFFYKLPCEVAQLGENIISKFYELNSKEEDWPGGKNSRPTQFIKDLKSEAI